MSQTSQNRKRILSNYSKNGEKGKVNANEDALCTSAEGMVENITDQHVVVKPIDKNKGGERPNSLINQLYSNITPCRGI